MKQQKVRRAFSFPVFSRACVFIYFAFARVGLRALAVFCMLSVSSLMSVSTQGQTQVDSVGHILQVSDSALLDSSRSIYFRINKAIVSQSDIVWLNDTLKPALMSSGSYNKVLLRSAASPEGPLRFNTQLAEWRCNAVKNFLNEMGIPDEKIEKEIVPEDYHMLVELMRRNNDRQYEFVKAKVEQYGSNIVGLKRALRSAYNGVLWKRLFRQYYSKLRAVRLIVVRGKEKVELITPLDVDTLPAVTDIFEVDSVPEMPDTVKVDTVTAVTDSVKVETPPAPVPAEEYVDSTATVYHREKWSVKTNLALYGLYLSQYGWAPVPNVAVEYYPMHGHYTFGASFDCPWWQGNTTNHKYFQIRNYQLEARRYFKSGDAPYGANGVYGPGKAFKGLYLQAYAHAFLYGIGFTDKKGWQGEGAGAGLGIGYVWQLGRTSRWSLELGAQFGGFLTKYDPYQYGCPVENTVDGLYYYKWKGSADLFRKRQYQTVYFGPTRVGLTLTYDLFYRKSDAKGQPDRSGMFKFRKKTTLKSRRQETFKIKKGSSAKW